jgi:hypothetical protein
VAGRVTGKLPEGGKAWVRLISVYSSREAESLVSPSGEFAVRMGSPGEYILMLLSGSDLLDTCRITLDITQADTVTQVMLRVRLADSSTGDQPMPVDRYSYVQGDPGHLQRFFV